MNREIGERRRREREIKMPRELMTVDTTEIEKNVTVLVETSTPKALRKGLRKAARQLLNYAKDEAPAVPVDTGRLKKSGFVSVRKDERGELVGYAGFRAPHAHLVHEGIAGHGTSGRGGRKFLESKLHAHSRDLMGVIVDTLKDEMAQQGKR